VIKPLVNFEENWLFPDHSSVESLHIQNTWWTQAYACKSGADTKSSKSGAISRN